MSNYSDSLKNPLWQRRRLEILQAAEFACSNCGSKEKTLHVHHCYYERGKKPWEYPDEALRSLCEDCHKDAGDQQLTLSKLMADFSIEAELIGYALGALSWMEPEDVISLESHEMASGFADYWGVDVDSVVIPQMISRDTEVTGHLMLKVIAETGVSSKRHILSRAIST